MPSETIVVPSKISLESTGEIDYFTYALIGWMKRFRAVLPEIQISSSTYISQIFCLSFNLRWKKWKFILFFCVLFCRMVRSIIVGNINDQSGSSVVFQPALIELINFILNHNRNWTQIGLVFSFRIVLQLVTSDTTTRNSQHAKSCYMFMNHN